MGHYRQAYDGDSELKQKQAELRELVAESAGARAALNQLRQEIADFQSYYDETLGRRLAYLEELEAEIGRYRGSSFSEGGGTRSAASAGDEQPAEWKSDVRDIKSLYREVAKAIHPDLARACPATVNRHELMSKANKAYADEDKRTLQEILGNWWQSRAQWDADWAELVGVKSRVAQQRKELKEFNARIEGLKNSWACQFKRRLDTGGAHCHLLADMITAVDLTIERAAARLAALEAGSQAPFSERREASAKALRFPDDFSCGTVYFRDRRSLDFTKWKKAGPAKGIVRVDDGMGARLDVTVSQDTPLHGLSLLYANDLQALYLLNASDTHLQDVLHLTGLEELYLTGSGITDAALAALSRLRNLKRLYLYNTAISNEGLHHLQRLPALSGLTSSGNRITDEGLAGFRRAQPQVKTVSFRWNR